MQIKNWEMVKFYLISDDFILTTYVFSLKTDVTFSFLALLRQKQEKNVNFKTA